MNASITNGDGLEAEFVQNKRLMAERRACPDYIPELQTWRLVYGMALWRDGTRPRTYHATW